MSPTMSSFAGAKVRIAQTLEATWEEEIRAAMRDVRPPTWRPGELRQIVGLRHPGSAAGMIQQTTRKYMADGELMGPRWLDNILSLPGGDTRKIVACKWLLSQPKMLETFLLAIETDMLILAGQILDRATLESISAGAQIIYCPMCKLRMLGTDYGLHDCRPEL